MHELNAEPSAEGDHLHRGFASLRERGVEETETKTILKISNGVDKCRVPKNGVLFVLQRGLWEMNIYDYWVQIWKSW